MEIPSLDPLLPVEGRHVLHLFFRVDYAAWDLLEGSHRIAAKTTLASLVQEIRATPATQLLTFSIVSPKADLGFMLLTSDLHIADAYAKQLALALGPGILMPEFSWFSMTERSEYTVSESEYAQQLEREENVSARIARGAGKDRGVSHANDQVPEGQARAEPSRLARRLFLSNVQAPWRSRTELVRFGF